PAHIVAGAVEEAATTHADLPNDGGEAGDGASRLAAIAVALHAIREFEQRGPGDAVAPCQPLEGLNRDACDPTDLLWGIGGGPLAQLLPAQGVGGEPGLVGQPVAEEDMHQAEGQRAAGGRPRLALPTAGPRPHPPASFN